MVDARLADQLERYGNWLEDSTGFSLHPELEVVQRGLEPTRTHRLLAVAAAVLLLVAGLAIVRSLDDGSDQRVASAPSDPPGPLFVLPAAGSGYSLHNGGTDTSVDPSAPAEIVTVGRRAGGWHQDLGFISLTEGPPDGTDDNFFSVAGREVAGGGWIQVWLGPDRHDEAAAVLAATSLAPDGTLVLDDSADLEIIERGATTPGWELAATFADVVDSAEPTDPIVVETVSIPSPVLLASPGVVDGEVARFDLDGIPAWRARRQDSNGEWNAIAWPATPNRIVAVSGPVAFDEILAIARSLEPVDEATWREAVGVS